MKHTRFNESSWSRLPFDYYFVNIKLPHRNVSLVDCQYSDTAGRFHIRKTAVDSSSKFKKYESD